jgi:hypothetical protein
VRLSHWEATQAHSIDQLKDGRVGPNAESKSGDGSEREGGSLPKDPDGIPEILDGGFNPNRAARISAFFFYLFYSACLPQGRGTRLLGWESMRDVPLRLALDVISQLIVQISFSFRTFQQPTKP